MRDKHVAEIEMRQVRRAPGLHRRHIEGNGYPVPKYMDIEDCTKIIEGLRIA